MLKAKAVCPQCQVVISYEICDSGSSITCGGCGKPFDLPVLELPEGYKVGGFEIQKFIGQGSMGNVYRALQLSMNRQVALKIIKPEITSDEENIADFLKEIQLLASFNHPNIVTAIEAGQQGNLHFLAMEYMQGISLEEPLEKGEVYTEKECLGYVLPISEALERAWDEYKLIHCDIKPANIMLDKNSNPKLMDLGISQCAHDQHSDGTIVGTPYYMSPEQSRAQQLDFRSDIFSLGATMFHMLSGQYPFWADNPMKVIEAVKNNPIDIDTLKKHKVSDLTCKMIKKMCAKDPERRFASWGEFRKEAEKCLNPPKASSTKPVRSMNLKGNANNRAKKVVQHRKKKQGFLVYILLAMAVTGIASYFAYKYISEKGRNKTNTEESDSPEAKSNETGEVSSAETPKEPVVETPKVKPKEPVVETPKVKTPKNIIIDTEKLYLTSINDQELSTLSGFSKVRQIIISNSRISNINVLKTLPRLEKLLFRNTAVNDFSAITSMTKLIFFEHNKAAKFDVGLLKNLPKLKTLKLNGVEDISSFRSGFTKLETIDLTGTHNLNLKNLTRLTNLRTLYLERSKVENLLPLKLCKKLLYISLKGSLFKREQLKAVVKVLPNCETRPTVE